MGHATWAMGAHGPWEWMGVGGVIFPLISHLHLNFKSHIFSISIPQRYKIQGPKPSSISKRPLSKLARLRRPGLPFPFLGDAIHKLLVDGLARGAPVGKFAQKVGGAV
jgi:hypothetical protein